MAVLGFMKTVHNRYPLLMKSIVLCIRYVK